MSDVSIGSEAKVLRGRPVSLEKLRAKARKARSDAARLMERYGNLIAQAETWERKAEVLADPNYVASINARRAEKAEKKASQAERILASLPPDVLQAILAKAGISV